jgi:sec-independent protein translocase protein TatC
MKKEEQAREKEVFEEKPFLEHIRELLMRLRRIIIVLLIITAIYFFFGINYVTISGYTIPILYPDVYNSISILLVRAFIRFALPPELTLINIGFTDTIYSSLYVSFYLGLFTSMPVIIREIWAFIAPGLYEHEKKTLKSIFIPAFLLFAAGSLFAYFIIVPLMLKFLYHYIIAFNVEPTLSLRAFIGTVTSLMMATGLAFELPLIMVTLTMAGIVKAITWRKYWRYGVFVGWLIAWIISPGTTGGIVESMIGIILSGLYIAGMYVASYVEKKRKSKKVSFITKKF